MQHIFKNVRKSPENGVTYVRFEATGHRLSDNEQTRLLRADFYIHGHVDATCLCTYKEHQHHAKKIITRLVSWMPTIIMERPNK